MLSYNKARALAEKWVELATDDSFRIIDVEDKPYGWVFYYQPNDYDPNDITTYGVGNGPIIINRFDGEIRTTGTAEPTECYLQEYESTLPAASLEATPERQDGVKKYR